MHQSVRSVKDSDNERVWRIHGFQDSGSGGECQFKEIPFREFYFEICTLLYTGSMLRCTRTGNYSAACAHDFYGTSGRLG